MQQAPAFGSRSLPQEGHVHRNKQAPLGISSRARSPQWMHSISASIQCSSQLRTLASREL